MNIQPTPQPPAGGADLSAEAHASLKLVAQASRQMQRVAFAWGGIAAVSFLVSANAPEALRSLFVFVQWAGLAVALVYLGRWLQCQRMELWLRRRQEPAPAVGQDWGAIPSASVRLLVRSYASVEEASHRGWSFGPAQARFAGQAVPGWASFENDRFVYDGLTSQTMVGAVPEDVRVFGKLSYRRKPVETPALPSEPLPPSP